MCTFASPAWACKAARLEALQRQVRPLRGAGGFCLKFVLLAVFNRFGTPGVGAAAALPEIPAGAAKSSWPALWPQAWRRCCVRRVSYEAGRLLGCSKYAPAASMGHRPPIPMRVPATLSWSGTARCTRRRGSPDPRATLQILKRVAVALLEVHVYVAVQAGVPCAHRRLALAVVPEHARAGARRVFGPVAPYRDGTVLLASRSN